MFLNTIFPIKGKATNMKGMSQKGWSFFYFSLQNLMQWFIFHCHYYVGISCILRWFALCTTEKEEKHSEHELIKKNKK